MAAPLDKSVFLQRVQALATQFIISVNEFKALDELNTAAGLNAIAANGGLDDAVDFTNFPGLTAEKVQSFFVTMEALLGPITAAQKASIYAVVRGQ